MSGLFFFSRGVIRSPTTGCLGLQDDIIIDQWWIVCVCCSAHDALQWKHFGRDEVRMRNRVNHPLLWSSTWTHLHGSGTCRGGVVVCPRSCCGDKSCTVRLGCRRQVFCEVQASQWVKAERDASDGCAIAMHPSVFEAGNEVEVNPSQCTNGFLVQPKKVATQQAAKHLDAESQDRPSTASRMNARSAVENRRNGSGKLNGCSPRKGFQIFLSPALAGKHTLESTIEVWCCCVLMDTAT